MLSKDTPVEILCAEEFRVTTKLLGTVTRSFDEKGTGIWVKVQSSEPRFVFPLCFNPNELRILGKREAA